MILVFIFFLICHCWFAQANFFWSLHWCSCHWWWKLPKPCSWLLCWYLHHLIRCLLFPKWSFFLFSIGSNWAPPCHYCFYSFYHFNHVILAFHQLWYHLCVMVFIFHVAFLIPVTISPSSPVFYYIHSHDETHHAGRYSHVIHFLNCEPLRGAIVILHLAFYSVSLVVTPSNAWVFPHFLWCFTF